MIRFLFLLALFFVSVYSFAQPVLQSFSPTSGPAGSLLTINGTNFSVNASENSVFFGAVKATVTSANTTQLQVTAPAGATYSPISVTVNKLTAYSTQPFKLTTPTDGSAISTGSFTSVANYNVGAYPFAVSLADLDNDGKSDIVAVNGAGNSISILKNHSNPEVIAFSTKLDYPTGPSPRRLAISDLDGDGRLDIVVTNFNSGNVSTISVFRNTSTDGIISFSPDTKYNTGNGSFGVAIADINLDGKPDIIVTSGNSGTVSILRNTTTSPGAISFSPKQDFTNFNHPNNVVVADLDKDGRPDFITSNFSGESISVYRNTSSGGVISLAPRIDYTTGQHSNYITTGDFDGDGWLDILVSASSGGISYFRNRSSSNSISLGAKQDYNLQNVTDFSLADFNGDGNLDILTGRRLSGLASVIQNTSTGTGNLAFANNINYSTGTYDSYVTAGDVDGDGKPELVVANTIQNNVSVLKNVFADPLVTSVIESENSQTLTLFPNPSLNSLYVTWNEKSYVTISVEILDLQGRRVRAKKSIENNSAIDLTGLPKGMYLVNIYEQDRLILNKKVIKL